MHRFLLLVGVALSVAVSPTVRAQLPEIEPNDNKASAAANGAFVLDALGVNNAVTGSTTGTSTTVAGAASADNFLIQTAPLPLGIYRHRLTLTTAGSVGHTGTIRGLTQTAGVANAGTDAVIQTSSTATVPPRYNDWYAFGKGEQITYRVTGVTATSMAYVSTLTTTPVQPLCISKLFQAGSIDITCRAQGHTTDTEFAVYDSNFDLVPGYSNDTSPAGCTGLAGTSPQSCMTRVFAPGIYYLAISNFNNATNATAPIDDVNQTAPLLDYPNAIANSSTTFNSNITFSMIDANGPIQVPATKPSQYSVVFYRFDVAPVGQNYPAWETNSPAASLGSPGTTATGNGPQILTTCPNTVQRIQFASTQSGACWFAAISSLPLVGAGICPGALGVNTLNGQAVNINVADPNLAFVNTPGGTICIPGFSSFDFPFVLSAGPLTISAQFAINDPSHPDGVALSAGLQINVLAGGFTPLAAPVVTVGDDAFSAIALGGCFSFYGAAFTQVFVASNGRWTFGVGSTDFSATVATAQTGPANVGAWCDIAEQLTAAGTITTTSPTLTTLRTDWVMVPYFGQATLSSTFAIEADITTGVITIFGVNGFAVYPVTSGATNQQFLGISRGVSIATNGGPTNFVATGSGLPTTVTDMIYTFGQAGTNSPGVTSITFTPVVGGPFHNGYLWSAL